LSTNEVQDQAARFWLSGPEQR